MSTSRRPHPIPTTRPRPRTGGAVPPRLRITEPGDLLALVPYLLGFHPTESVVTVFLRAGRVLFTARVDLPPLAGAEGFAQQLDRLGDQHQVAEAVLVVYAADGVEGRTLLSRLVGGLERLVATDALLVDGSRWWSMLCEQDPGASCCPAEGRPYAVDAHRMAAEAVFVGLGVRADREAVEALVAGPVAAESDRLERLAAALRPELAALAPEQAARLVETTIHRTVVEREPLDEDARVTLALLVTDLRLRDLAWAAISRLDALDHVQLWSDVVAVAPRTLSSAPLCLLGLAAWVSGDGALQNCCAARLKADDPTYSLGVLLADISARALPPSVWDELRAELRASSGPIVGGRDLH